MQRIVLALVLTGLCFASALTAEEAELRAFEEFPQALGVFFGEVGGMGLSYHQWFPEVPGSGANLAFGVLYSPSADSEMFYNRYLDYTLGVEYHHSVYGEDFAPWLTGQLYLWGGIGHHGYIANTYDYEAENPVDAPGPFTPTVTGGIGIGIEVILFRHFSFPAEVGYAATYNFAAGSFKEGFNVRLIPQAGVRYRY